MIHVVVDGGSTDGTVEWLSHHHSQFAVAVSEKDKGIYDAMNKALERTPDVDWVVFLNAGDVFHNDDVVRRSLSLLQRDDLDFVFGDVCITDAAGPGKARRYPSRRSTRLEMPGCHQSCFVRFPLMKQLRFDLHYKVAGDFECWLRATHQGGSKTGFVDHTVATIAPEGFSARNEPTLQREYVRAIRTHVNAMAAGWWLLMRKARQILLKLRPSPASRSA
jgi:glycosyltransferase involved in cell wall biosynthesis